MANRLDPFAEDELVTLTGLDSALIGIGTQCGQVAIAIYSRELIIDAIVERDGMTREEAVEFVEYNIDQTYLGERTPIIMETTYYA